MDPETLMTPEKEMENERRETRGPGPETKGGGLKGGPKRWTGRGPAPARHIPWPEIFKHHISVIEGHLKMTDMVRKHTVEGSGNHRTIMGVISRTKEMLSQARQIGRTFVPPPKERYTVPVGSSSVSMYPGYSPADHLYGKAAEEYGKAAAAAQAMGEEIPSNPDAEYQVGQGRGSKRPRTLAEIKAAKRMDGNQDNKDASTSEIETNGVEAKPQANGSNQKDTPSGDNPYFIVDTNPTPVTLDKMAAVANSQESVEGSKHKKQKKKHSGDLPAAPSETQDIASIVDARLKKKEEKAKRKEEKKRKRESERSEPANSNAEPTSSTSAVGDTTVPAPNAENVEVTEKPKKKKSKTKHEGQAELTDRTKDKKRKGEESNGTEGEGKGKKRKKNKDSKTAKS